MIKEAIEIEGVITHVDEVKDAGFTANLTTYEGQKIKLSVTASEVEAPNSDMETHACIKITLEE